MGRSLIEVYLSLMGYPLKEAETELSYAESLTDNSFSDWQDRKRREIFEHHLSNNPFYRSLLNGRKPDSWEDIPVLKKSDFQRPLKELLTPPYSLSNVYVSSTSGSSGNPFIFAKDKFTHSLSWLHIKRLYNSVGVDLNDGQGRFYGIPLEFPGYFRERLKDIMMNRIRFPVYDLSDKYLKQVVKKIVTSRLKYLYGYTSSIVIFARYLIKAGINLKEQSQSLGACVFTSELATEEDIQLAKLAFGVPVFIEYGSSELGVMGFDPGSGVMTGSDSLMYFEQWKNEDGLYEVLLTSLYNKAFPIIRYRIGDLIELERLAGRTVIKRLVGRTNDVIRLPSGRIAAGFTFYYISRSILEEAGILLKEFIARQTRIDTFELDIVSDRQLSLQEEALIRMKIEKYLETGLSIKFNYTSKIDRPRSGKVKHFYSELKE